MRSGGCSLGRIWDLLWVGALLNAHALWAGLGCQNHEPGWAESWETPASSLGPKQGLRKSLRGLHPVASKHEKPLLNMYAYVHTQVYMYVHRHACAHVYLHAQACVRLCTHTCICVHRCVCVPVHACMCSPSQTPRGSGRGTHGPEHPAQKHHPEQTGLLAPAQGSSHEPGMRTLMHRMLLPAHQMRLRDTTPCTHHAHEARLDHTTQSHAGSRAHLHTYTETHTHSSSCAQVFTPTHEHSRATHAQKQHKHPDTCVHAPETHISAP